MSRGYMNVDAARMGVVNNVAVATTSTSVASAAFGTQTFQVRVAATANSFYTVGKTPTAAATDVLLPLNWVEYVTVAPGEKIAFFSPTIQTISVVEVAM